MGLREWLTGYKSPTTRIRMVVSLGEYVAGESYDLPVEQADGYIVKGYATGLLSREIGHDEMAHMTRLDQKVGV